MGLGKAQGLRFSRIARVLLITDWLHFSKASPTVVGRLLGGLGSPQHTRTLQAKCSVLHFS